jgi:hypothetical protein
MAEGLVVAIGPAGAANKPILCVPAKALAEGGAEPEIGDEVSAQVEGVVRKSRDGYVWAEVTKVNGEAVKEPAKEEGSPKRESVEDMGARLGREARAEDRKVRSRAEAKEELLT